MYLMHHCKLVISVLNVEHEQLTVGKLLPEHFDFMFNSIYSFSVDLACTTVTMYYVIKFIILVVNAWNHFYDDGCDGS